MSPCDRFVWVKLDVAFKSMHVCIQECKDPIKREFHDIPEGMVRIMVYVRHNGASKLVLFERKAFNMIGECTSFRRRIMKIRICIFSCEATL